MHSIVVFTCQGEYITTYNSGVNRPVGIAIDTFVTDNKVSYPRRQMGARGISQSVRQQQDLISIVMLDYQHKIIATWPAGQNGTGITLDKEGSIYVCDYSGCHVFKY